MRMINSYSLFNAVIFGSIGLTVVLVLGSRPEFLKKYGVSSLLFIFVLALLRLALPLDLILFNYVFFSPNILLPIWKFFRSFRWVGIFLLAVWGTGTAIVFAKDSYALMCAYRICRNYTTREDPRVQQIAASLSVNCPVVVSPDVTIPYVAGLFRHTIYLPAQELPDSDVELILRHELQHIRSHDSQIKLLFGLLSAIFWWNPIIWKFRKELDPMLELHCDAAVTEPMSAVHKEQYVGMLLGMIKQLAASQPKQMWSAAARSTEILRQRFTIMFSYLDAPPQRMKFSTKCCLIAVFLASYMVLIRPGSKPPLEGNEWVAITTSPTGAQLNFFDRLRINRDTSFILNLEGEYTLIVNGRELWTVKYSDIVNGRYSDLELIIGELKEN